MARAFVALRLDPVAERQLAALGARLSKHAGGAPLVPDDLHVTLRFLGEVDVDVVGVPVFERAAARLSDVPAMLAFDALTAFPSDAHATVLVAEATRVPDALRDLVAELERAGAALGVPKEPRRFRPHVTLVRFRKGKPVTLPAMEPVVASVRALSLCTTHIPGIVPRYEDVRSVPI